MFRLKSKWIMFAIVGCLLTSINAFAQIPIQNAPVTPRQTIQLQLGNATARLNRIEAAFNRIERQNVFAMGDSEEISQATLEYAQAMKAALDNALQNAQTLANTQGRQGSITPLETFERTEKPINRVCKELNKGQTISITELKQELSELIDVL